MGAVSLELDRATEAWLQSKGVRLVPIPETERAAAARRIANYGDPAKRRALRMVALWSLAPVVAQRPDGFTVRDIADFIEAEGFALEDAEGERTLVPEEDQQ